MNNMAIVSILSMLGRLPSSRCLELYRVLSRSICPSVGGGRSGRSDRLRWENSIDFTELAFLARKKTMTETLGMMLFLIAILFMSMGVASCLPVGDACWISLRHGSHWL